MRTLLTLLSVVLLLSGKLSAQEDLTKSVGIRGGDMSGITYRLLHTDFSASEVLLSFRNNGMQATFLKQHIRPTLGEIGKNFYFINGYGIHAGFTNESEFRIFYTRYEYSDKHFSPLLGVDGYLGVEYRFREIPISIGLDYKPYFEFSTYNFFSLRPWDTAFMIKYNFD